MSEKRPLALYDGVTKELQTGDTLPIPETNASSTQFELVGGVFQIKESWLTDFVNALIAGGLPVASDVTITGTETQGQTLELEYVYSGGTEGTSTFKWYRSDDNIGTGKTVISGATNQSYVLQLDDVGKHIQGAVTPKNAGGVAGTEVFSDYSGAIAALTVLLVPKFLLDGTGTQAPGQLTATSANMRSVGLNTIDTSASTLAVKRIGIKWHASWPGKEFTFGLCIYDYPEAPNQFAFSWFKYADNTTVSKAQAIEQLNSYTVPDNVLSQMQIRTVNDGGFHRLFLETTDDGGATPWVVRNTVAQGGEDGYLSDIPWTTDLYPQFYAYDSGVVFDYANYDL